MLALRTPTPGYADWLRLRILLTKCSRPNNKIHNKYWNFILYIVVIFLSVKEARVWMIYHKYEVKCKVFIFIMDSSKEMSPYIASQSVPRRQQQLCKVRRGELRWGLRLSGRRGEWWGLQGSTGWTGPGSSSVTAGTCPGQHWLSPPDLPTPPVINMSRARDRY